MWHHFWQYRTRWQAWDYPQRGHERFIDLHAAGVNGGLLLPLHLGWWGFQSFNPPQIEPTYPDVIENLGARLVGWDAGISLTAGIDRETLRNTPLFRRAVDILRTCEELRHANTFDEAARAKLREPGSQFALVTDAAGKPRFRRAQSQAQTVAPAEPWTLAWQVTNAFQPQPVRFRMEALMSAAPITDTNALLLADLTQAGAEPWKTHQRSGRDLHPDAGDKPERPRVRAGGHERRQGRPQCRLGPLRKALQPAAEPEGTPGARRRDRRRRLRRPGRDPARKPARHCLRGHRRPLHQCGFHRPPLLLAGRDRVNPLERLRLERRQKPLQRLSGDH